MNRIQSTSGTFHTSSSNTGTASGSFSAKITPNNSILVSFGRFGAFNGTPGSLAVRDSLGNRYVQVFDSPGTDVDGSGVAVAYFLARVTVGGIAEVFCTATNPSSNFVDINFSASEYFGPAAFISGASIFDNTSINPGDGVGDAAVSANAGYQLISSIFDANGNNWSPAAGWTNFATVDNDNTQMQVADRSISFAGSYGADWVFGDNVGSSESWIATIALAPGSSSLLYASTFGMLAAALAGR